MGKVEEVARAMHRYAGGTGPFAAGPPRWLIYDRAEQRTLSGEVFDTRAKRDGRIIELNARAAIAAIDAWNTKAGYVTVPREPTEAMVKCGLRWSEQTVADHRRGGDRYLARDVRRGSLRMTAADIIGLIAVVAYIVMLEASVLLMISL